MLKREGAGNEILGSWFLVLGSWFLVLGSWFLCERLLMSNYDLRLLVKALRSGRFNQGPVFLAERGRDGTWYYTVGGVACEVFGITCDTGTGPTIRSYSGVMIGVPECLSNILDWETIYELESNGLTFASIAGYIERKILGITGDGSEEQDTSNRQK